MLNFLKKNIFSVNKSNNENVTKIDAVLDDLEDFDINKFEWYKKESYQGWTQLYYSVCFKDYSKKKLRTIMNWLKTFWRSNIPWYDKIWPIKYKNWFSTKWTDNKFWLLKNEDWTVNIYFSDRENKKNFIVLSKEELLELKKDLYKIL